MWRYFPLKYLFKCIVLIAHCSFSNIITAYKWKDKFLCVFQSSNNITYEQNKAFVCIMFICNQLTYILLFYVLF